MKQVFRAHRLCKQDGPIGPYIESYAAEMRGDTSLWETTQIYLEANLAMKEEILAKTTPPGGKPGRYRPGDALLAFLKDL